MEGREGMTTALPAAVVPAAAVPAAPVPTSENTSQVGPTAASVPFPPPVIVALPGSASATQLKKKRGRPRKYGPDGSVSLALSPMPISSSAPAGSGMGPMDFRPVKRGRGRPAGSLNKPKVDFYASGEWAGSSAGANFTPHVITVAAGEDVTMKIISFSQQGPRAICILSANGAISNVTLRQPDSSGGTLTYEGRFEILSLSGSFMPTEIGGTRSRSGGLSVSLSSPDGRVVGGGVAGLLVAASPVQVVVGSFMPNMHDQMPKRPKIDAHTVSMPTAAVPISSADLHETYTVQARLPTTPKPNLTPSSSFRGDNWGPVNTMQDTRTSSSTDINISLPGG